jgi:hypothetical protein
VAVYLVAKRVVTKSPWLSSIHTANWLEEVPLWRLNVKEIAIPEKGSAFWVYARERARQNRTQNKTFFIQDLLNTNIQTIPLF